MNECFLLVSDVHKGGIERRKNLLHFSQVNIPDGKTVPFAGLFVELNQPMVFHQRDVNFCRCDIDNQIFLRFF